MAQQQRYAFLGSPAEGAERAFSEASSTAELLKTRMLECMRAAESVLQQRERYRRRARAANQRDVVQAVLAHVTLDELTASCLIKALARTEHAQLSITTADWLLETQPQVAGTSQVLDAAIAAASLCEFQPDTALRFYQLRDSYGLPPSVQAVNLAITACSHSGRVKDALELLEGMAERGLVPTTYSVLMTLQAANFKHKGRVKEALRALACLPQPAPPQPPQHPPAVVDAVLAVFEAAMNKAHSLDEVEDLYDRLRGVGLADATRVYNAVLRACAKRGDWREARAYFDQMASEDVPADTNTFNALILACVKGQALDVALDIYEWLISGRDVTEPIPADITTYNTLIKACHQAGMLEKALEIARWVTSTGTEWDATTYSELMSTVEIAQIWDNKVVTTPFHQMQSRFARGSGGDHGDAGLWEEDVASSTTEELPLPQPSVAHSATAWLVGASRPMTAVGGAHGSEYGSMAMAGHSGFASALSAGLASVSRAGAAGREPGASPGGAAAGRKAVPTSQMLPLAIFPDQLRPAPYDGLRMLFLDQLNDLNEEALLSAVKLKDISWAARTLMRGGMGPEGKAAPVQLTSAATAMHGGQGVFTTAGKRAKAASPSHGRQASLQPPEPVQLSPAPSFNHINMDTVNAERLQVLNALVEGSASPKKDPRGHGGFNGFHGDADGPPGSPKPGHYGGGADGSPEPLKTAQTRSRADAADGLLSSHVSASPASISLHRQATHSLTSPSSHTAAGPSPLAGGMASRTLSQLPGLPELSLKQHPSASPLAAPG